MTSLAIVKGSIEGFGHFRTDCSVWRDHLLDCQLVQFLVLLHQGFLEAGKAGSCFLLHQVTMRKGVNVS